MRDLLFIQMAREPLPGKVKTRMLPELSPEEACELHSELVLWTARTLTGTGLGDVELHVAGDTGAGLFRLCRELGVAAVSPQQDGDLGERMYHALARGLERYSRVILVGSDCPQMDRAYLAGAAALLDEADVVLGPALDGGYVLIGGRKVEPGWFEGVEWGTDYVYASTVAHFESSGVHWQPLPVLQDIDRPEDLPVWRAITDSLSS